MQHECLIALIKERVADGRVRALTPTLYSKGRVCVSPARRPVRACCAREAQSICR